MESHPPPVRVIAPGRVYRRDNFDATHTPMFTQVEGLVVDEGISLGDLKGTLNALRRAVLRRARSRRASGRASSRTPSRRPSSTSSARAATARAAALCKHTGWIEVLGCGMVHPGGVRGRRLRRGASTRASRSASASSGWRCVCTASTTSACSTRTTSASSSSSRHEARRSPGSASSSTSRRIRPAVAARLGACGFDVESVEGDVIDFEITANRPTASSVYGLAREAAAAFSTWR